MTTRSEIESRGLRQDDQSAFEVWGPGKSFNDRLRFDGCELSEDTMRLSFWCPSLERNLFVETDTHLLVKYSNESANFLEFDQLPIDKQRMFVSTASDWLREFTKKSVGVFDDVLPRHYVFVFSNASVEMICIGEPRISER